MDTITGVYSSAQVFTCSNSEHGLDSYAAAQLQNLCDNPVAEGSVIRVMPDVHPGKVCTIGLTMTVRERVIPHIVGIDIGCGMTMAKIKAKKIEFQKLDKVIREKVPSGFGIRKDIHRWAAEFEFDNLLCAPHINRKKAELSLGTLGGGNHFIELDKDGEGNVYLVVHSGSRHLGKEATDHYVDAGAVALKKEREDIPYPMTFLEGKLKEEYLQDLQVVQEYAELNRRIMIDEITRGMKWKVIETCSCIHNYVDFSWDIPILRKGAISARAGESVIIPVNMRDGIILGKGLGNAEWNYSAPHGAGRIAKREDIAANHTLAEFKSVMKGIYSPSISKGTLDEAPFAYRSLEEIQDVIQETVQIDKVITPVYNFKAEGGK